jgi:hypothetical protein
LHPVPNSKGYQVKLQLIEEAKRSREVGKARLAELEALIAEHAAKQTELEGTPRTTQGFL